MPRDPEERRAIYGRCERALSHAAPAARLPATVLAALAARAGDEMDDAYGEGGAVARLEARICELLGTEAAILMPSGTMAQQIALRIASDRRGISTVAFHPRSHLELHEERGYDRLHGLHGCLIGHPDRLLTLDDLVAVREPIAALLLELPQREIGGLLPTWSDLVALTTAARGRGLHLHLDGARLWESQPYYGRPHADICDLFGSVYVSLYKGLGGIAGCVLAGSAEMIGEARVWRRRHGGTLPSLTVLALSGDLGLDERLPRMPAYWARARALADELASLPGVEIVPDPPQTPMMHVFLRGDAEALVEASLQVAEERGVWLFGGLQPTRLPDVQRLEVTAGDATLDLADGEAGNLFAEVFERARHRA